MTRPVLVAETLRILEMDPATPIPDLATLKALVRRQYRILAKRHHPDRGGDAERMKEINRVAAHVRQATTLVFPAPPTVSPARTHFENVLREQMAKWAATHGVQYREHPYYQQWQAQAQAAGSTANPAPGDPLNVRFLTEV